MTVSSRIHEARKLKLMNQRQLGDRIGVTAATISDWERGKANPDVEKIGLLMSTLGVDANYLFQDLLDGALALSKLEQSTLFKLRELSPANQQLVDAIIKTILEKQQETHGTPTGTDPREFDANTPKISVQLYFAPVRANSSYMLFDDPANAQMEVYETTVSKKADLIMQISGNAMEPNLSDKDLVFVKKQPYIDDGDIGVFLIKGNSEIREKKGNFLHASNAKVPDIPISQDTVCFGKILGKAF